MKVLIFGATGMVGQGVLRECLLDDAVTLVRTVGRAATGITHAKLSEVVHGDLFDCAAIEGELTGFDACFFCLGVSSAGMASAEYERLTYTLTMGVAECVARCNKAMTFVYVSGAGTDGSEKGRVEWARVKGRTENALQRLPFKGAYMFRPGIIQPVNGERSKTRVYQTFYTLGKPVLGLLRRLFPRHIVTTEQVGRAMIEAARDGYAKPVLESWDIRDCSKIS